MYYFGYCTWLTMPNCALHAEREPDHPGGRAKPPADSRRRRPPIAAGAISTTNVRMHGARCRGVVFEHENIHFRTITVTECTVTVIGDDGKTYDCWTYRLIAPGIPINRRSTTWICPEGLRIMAPGLHPVRSRYL